MPSQGHISYLTCVYDAERGIRTLMNDTVRTGLNRVRLPISPSPQGDATKGSQIIFQSAYVLNI